MKRIILATCLLVSSLAFAGDKTITIVSDLFDAKSISAGTNAVSSTVSLAAYKAVGYCSIQVSLASGVIDAITFEVTNDGSTWSVATMNVEGAFVDLVYDEFTTTSGPQTNGIDLIGIGLPICKQFRVRCAATSNLVVSASLVHQ